MDNMNKIVIPVYELDDSGLLKPNPAFHRPFDKLHSRCMEYPFAASQIADACCILDVGTVKSDPLWISWLENLPIEVHATDYDLPLQPFKKVVFHQADVRNLPFADGSFDKILAVSVIEHIGLQSPQVFARSIPEIDTNGDLAAVKELARVLKAGGELIMTFPFGKNDGLILADQARAYSLNSIQKFEKVLKPVLLHYYEYQHAGRYDIYNEYKQEKEAFSCNVTLLKMKAIIKGIFHIYTRISSSTLRQSQERSDQINKPPNLPGVVVWREVPLSQANATHIGHVDGVLCSVWKKQ
jgi:SAM-dependent methyltransferase